MIRVIAEAIDTRAVTDAVRHPSCGAILTFEGVGRDEMDGRPVVELDYEAWPAVAEREMATIAAEAEARWAGTRVAMVHRTGRVAIGEPSVVIAVGTPHRAEAYEASRYCIDQLKVRVPVWKKERYADGEAWIANRGSSERT
jgi:molybdopterin synthase catalytic subunit